MGLIPPDIIPITTRLADFTAKISANVTARWTAQSARQAKDDSRDELSFVTLDTSTPYIVEYDGEDGSKTAHYMLRWVKSSGDKGPWSETVSATIAA